jgi:IclR family transcriptional regulator, KDG regulon repressor
MGRPLRMTERRGGDGAQVVGRALDLLDTLAGSAAELSLTELARRLGLHKSTAHRILTALGRRDYVTASPSTHRYSLGPRCLYLAARWQSRVDVREKARPHLEDLREKCHETVSLNLLIGDKRVPVESLEAPHLLRYIVALGESFPLWLGASGKAILAFLPEERVRRVCAVAEGLDPRALALELKRIRMQGHAIGGRLPSTQAVSAPVFQAPGTVMGSVSIVMPEARFTADVKRFCIEQIMKAGQAVSREIGMDSHAAPEQGRPRHAPGGR